MKRIYKITNIVNNKIYIGKTIKTLEQRFKEHLLAAKRWKYNEDNGIKNKNQSRLYPAMNKYGYDNFKIDLVEEVSEDLSLEDQEKYWIRTLDTTNDKIGYNISKGGLGGDLFRGHHHSETSKKLISKVSKGKKQDSEFVKYRTKNLFIPVQNILSGEVYKNKAALNPITTKVHVKMYKFEKYIIFRYYQNYYIKLVDKNPVDLDTLKILYPKVLVFYTELDNEAKRKSIQKLKLLYQNPKFIEKQKIISHNLAAIKKQKLFKYKVEKYNIDIEQYKKIHQVYLYNCPNKHLEEAFHIPYSSIRWLNKYLDLPKGANQNGKVNWKKKN